MADDRRLAADHEAEAALEAPDASAGADVDVVKVSRLELGRAANVVVVVRIASIDHDVARLQLAGQTRQGLVHHGRRHHQPDGSGLLEPRHEVVQRGRSTGAFLGQPLDRRRAHVIDHALVTSFHEPPHHVGAHPTEADHAELHAFGLLSSRALTEAGYSRFGLAVYRLGFRLCVGREEATRQQCVNRRAALKAGPRPA